MSATVEKLPVPRRFRAWCPEHADGYQGGKIAANNWAFLHNSNHHQTEAVPTGAASDVEGENHA